ncbi:unnamed protein product [Prunus armeniaca]|uniref:Uncharacterized protein n=1 Tax=Prunus armeniaca TaxID=36596 RepID=A0A6J5U1X2_PRUAR|nr:unnamed protein product [Prunus armeniaca]CAB4300739.1 unnamed protein product [Prunus armeniaca]
MLKVSLSVFLGGTTTGNWRLYPILKEIWRYASCFSTIQWQWMSRRANDAAHVAAGLANVSHQIQCLTLKFIVRKVIAMEAHNCKMVMAKENTNRGKGWQLHLSIKSSYKKTTGPSKLPTIGWLVNGDTKDLSSSSIRILSFDFKKKKFYWTPHPVALEKKPSLRNFLHVLNFKESLALVEFSSSEDKYMKIWALKNNYGNKEWVLNYKIDAGQYLLSLPLGNLSLSECGEWEHDIFFNQ